MPKQSGKGVGFSLLQRDVCWLFGLLEVAGGSRGHYSTMFKAYLATAWGHEEGVYPAWTPNCAETSQRGTESLPAIARVMSRGSAGLSSTYFSGFLFFPTLVQYVLNKKCDNTWFGCGLFPHAEATKNPAPPKLRPTQQQPSLLAPQTPLDMCSCIQRYTHVSMWAHMIELGYLCLRNIPTNLNTSFGCLLQAPHCSLSTQAAYQ